MTFKLSTEFHKMLGISICVCLGAFGQRFGPNPVPKTWCFETQDM